jgi:hypothetical protein
MSLATHGGIPTMPTRRSVVATGLVVGAAGLAGCEQRDDRTPSGGPVTGGVETLSGGSGDTTVEVASFESGEGSCGEAATAEITRTDGGVSVSGTIVSPTPCYQAELADSGVENRTAIFRIAVSQDAAVEACVECIGSVPFELSATLGTGIEAVLVDLGGNEPTRVSQDLS